MSLWRAAFELAVLLFISKVCGLGSDCHERPAIFQTRPTHHSIHRRWLVDRPSFQSPYCAISEEEELHTAAGRMLTCKYSVLTSKRAPSFVEALLCVLASSSVSMEIP